MARTLYYTDSTNTNSPATLWRIPVAGGAAVKIVDGVNSTSFDVVNGGIYYLEQIAGEIAVAVFRSCVAESHHCGWEPRKRRLRSGGIR